MPQRQSIIDLGTNTVLMVTGQPTDDGGITILGDEHRVGRLGKGVDGAGKIREETFDRIAGIFSEYRAIAEELGADSIRAFGTSALRDAANRDDFIAAMRERTGIEPELVSGKDEAIWTWTGALFGHEVGAEPTTVLDIGGGSTEIGSGASGAFRTGTSVDVGAVRVTERFFGETLPPDPERVADARRFTRELFSGAVQDEWVDGPVVGVAGTVTTLAAIFGTLTEFDPETIDGMKLPSEWIHTFTDSLLRMSLEEIETIPQVIKGREDILPGGALVLSEFVRTFDVPEIVVSTRGLRYGLLMRALGTTAEREISRTV